MLAVALASAFPLAAGPIPVVATTAMVADLVRGVGGDRIQLETLMGPGVDPHLFKATAGDLVKLQRANVIFYNGLLLEGKMTDVLRRMSRNKPHIFAVAERLPSDRLLKPADFEGHPDPHVWFDVSLWLGCVDAVVDGLSAADPAGAEGYRERGRSLKERLEVLHRWALAKANELPQERRILITSHDAYNYFGRAYGFEVVGLQGISTVSEAGLSDMARLVDFVRSRQVKAVFVESSVSPATLRRIAQDSGAVIGGELFSDAMGVPGQVETRAGETYDLGTYEGMVKHNLITIVEALK